MNDHDLLALLHKAHDDLGRLLNSYELPDQRDGLTVLQRIRESFNGWPRSTGFTGSMSRSATDENGEQLPNYADPTGNAAEREDKAAQDRRGMDKDAHALERHIESLYRTASRYVLREASRLDREDTDDIDVPGCQSCCRVPSPGTVGKPKSQQSGWYNRVDITTTLADGTPVRLCDWCWRGPVGVKHTGELPVERFVAMHRDGKRVLRSA